MPEYIFDVEIDVTQLGQEEDIYFDKICNKISTVKGFKNDIIVHMENGQLFLLFDRRGSSIASVVEKDLEKIRKMGYKPKKVISQNLDKSDQDKLDKINQSL